MTVRNLIDTLADKPMDAVIVLDLFDGHSVLPLKGVFDGKYLQARQAAQAGLFIHAKDVGDGSPGGTVLAVMLQAEAGS